MRNLIGGLIIVKGIIIPFLSFSLMLTILKELSKYKDYATLEMDFRNDEEIIRKSNRAALEKYISSSKLSSRWIYNPIVSKYYSDIIKRSEVFCRNAEKLRKEKKDKAKN